MRWGGHYFRTRIGFSFLKSVLIAVRGEQGKRLKKAPDSISDILLNLIPESSTYEVWGWNFSSKSKVCNKVCNLRGNGWTVTMNWILISLLMSDYFYVGSGVKSVDIFFKCIIHIFFQVPPQHRIYSQDRPQIDLRSTLDWPASTRIDPHQSRSTENDWVYWEKPRPVDIGLS